jgi:uncharacterized protein
MMTTLTRFPIRFAPALLLLAGLLFSGFWPQPDQASDVDDALLWRIDTPDGGTSYLLGTMHVSDPRVIDNLAPQTLEAMDASHSAVFELILGQQNQGALVQRMMLDEGRGLEEILGKGLFDQLTVIAQPYGMIPSALKYLRPWAVFLMLSVPPEETFRQARGQFSLDALLQDHAEAADKRLLALETIDEQLSIFETMSESDQIAIMTDLVANKPEMDALYEAVLVAYVDRDLGEIYELASMAGEGDPGLAERFNESLILERNDRMAERLLPMVEQGGYFVAVGAMHLPGDNGLLAQLEDNGFAISPIH